MVFSSSLFGSSHFISVGVPSSKENVIMMFLMVLLLVPSMNYLYPIFRLALGFSFFLQFFEIPQLFVVSRLSVLVVNLYNS